MTRAAQGVGGAGVCGGRRPPCSLRGESNLYQCQGHVLIVMLFILIVIPMKIITIRPSLGLTEASIAF